MAEKDKFDEFLEEVEQDIRHEKYFKLWQKYGRFITGGAIGILAVVASYNIYSHYEIKHRQEVAQKFADVEQLVARGQVEQALGVLASLSHETTKTFPLLADFSRAALLKRQGGSDNLAKAQEIYQSLSENPKCLPKWQDLAKLLHIYIDIEQNHSSYDVLIKKLEPLYAENAPWRSLALETAGILHYKNGAKAQASEIFVRLAQDKNTSEGIMIRSQLISQILSTEELT
jgi:hypothetical protein